MSVTYLLETVLEESIIDVLMSCVQYDNYLDQLLDIIV